MKGYEIWSNFLHRGVSVSISLAISDARKTEADTINNTLPDILGKLLRAINQSTASVATKKRTMDHIWVCHLSIRIKPVSKVFPEAAAKRIV
jgi:hypothetical protein